MVRDDGRQVPPGRRDLPRPGRRFENLMGTNEDTRELLAAVVDDFDAVYRAYDKAGLLADDARTEAARKLLGNGDDVYRFKREFLLADALVRNRVGRAVYGSTGGGDDGPRHLAVFGGNN